MRDAPLGKLRGIDRPFHQRFSPQEKQPAQLPGRGGDGHLLSDVKPWQRRAIPDEIDRQVSRVGRADQKIRSRPLELPGRLEQERPERFPVAGIDPAQVVAERKRVERDFGVGTRAEEGASFRADRLITQGGAFRGDRDDTDVPRHFSSGAGTGMNSLIYAVITIID